MDESNKFGLCRKDNSKTSNKVLRSPGNKFIINSTYLFNFSFFCSVPVNKANNINRQKN